MSETIMDIYEKVNKQRVYSQLNILDTILYVSKDRLLVKSGTIIKITDELIYVIDNDLKLEETITYDMIFNDNTNAKNYLLILIKREIKHLEEKLGVLIQRKDELEYKGDLKWKKRISLKLKQDIYLIS